MISSGSMKRGLAATAISALAVTGLPFLATSAHAEPNSSQYGAEEVQLLSQFSGVASTKNDGQNTTVRLEAGAGTGVSSVTFQYNTNNPDTWVTIATVTRNDDGAFAYEWDATALNGAEVDLRAFETGTTPVVLPVDGDGTDVREDVLIRGGGVAEDSVNLNDGSAKGVFQAPYTNPDTDTDGPGTDTDTDGDPVTGDYVILDGTTSATGGSVSLFDFDGNPDGNAQGTAPVEAEDGATTGTFAGIADINGYNFTGSPDELAFGAENDSDDVESYTLYQQEIDSVTAEPTSNSIPDSQDDAEITVTVLDQNGEPIANAEVRPADTSISDPDVAYTDENGEATFDQRPGTTYYYANATDADGFDSNVGDERSADVTVSQFVAEPTTLDGDSNDGAAFDFDEYSPGDITVQVEDQAGNPIDTTGQTLSYYWEVTPFDTDEEPYRVPAEGEDTQAVSDNGEYVVDFPEGEPGTYELFASLGEVPLQGGGDIAESSVLTVKAGEASVAYDEADPEVAPAGTTENVSGSLELEDGTGLAGRGLNFVYDSTGNAQIEEDSGTADDGNIVTGAGGSFSFDVVDPAVAAPATQPTERGDLVVTAVDATNDDDNVGDVGPDNQTVVFAADAAPDDSEITLGGETGDDKPGEVKDVTVHVDDTVGEGGASVTNTLVTLTVDEGFFTDATGTANYGQETTVATDNLGNATAYISIERNAGFDDDGDVTSTVTATSGDATDTEEYDWTTDGTTEGTVDLVFSDEQTVTVLPKAPFETEVVYFDVFAYDQFGNPIDDVTVTVDGDFIDNTDEDAPTVQTDLANDQDLVAWQNSAGSEEYTVTWANAVVNPEPAPNTDAEDSETIDWYAIEVDSATLTESGTSPHGVGSTVTMTYKAVDQHGEPIEGYDVEFYRSGPDNTHDGDLETTKETNAKGEAYYVFQGEVAGTARVTTVLYDTNGDLVPAGQAEDAVTFGGRSAITAVLSGTNNGADADRLKVNAPSKAAGATVKLFKIRKDGSRKLVATESLNSNGNKSFTVDDKNGNRFTKFIAKVLRTSDTKADWTNEKRVR